MRHENDFIYHLKGFFSSFIMHNTFDGDILAIFVIDGKQKSVESKSK